MKRLKKRVIGIVTSIVMVISIFMSSANVGAQDITTRRVTTEAELISEIDNAVDNVDTSIIIDAKIEVTERIIIKADKKITLSSSLNEAPTLVRENNYKGYILIVETGGSLITHDIIIDGQKDISSNIYGGLLYVLGEFEMNEGTVLRNSSVTDRYSNAAAPYYNQLNGAAIYLANGATVNINGGVISDNKGNGDQNLDGGGGAVFASPNSTLTIMGGLFKNNVDKKNGGAVSASGGKLTIGGEAEFINNSTIEGSGGAVNMYLTTQSTGEFIMTGGKFVDNDSAYYGGAIRLYSNNSGFTLPATITGGTFTGNKSFRTGGAIEWSKTDLKIVGNVLFENNESLDGWGGAIGSSTNQTGNLYIDGAIFVGNKAESIGGRGGAIGVFSGLPDAPNGLVVKNSKFMDNVAGHSGGAIYASVGERKIFENVEIDNNIAIAGSGGGIYISGYTNAEITSSTIINNSAAKGGGIYVLGQIDSGNASKTIITDTLIQNNHAFVEQQNQARTGFGGGILLDRDAKIYLRDSVLTENTADNQGSAIAYQGNKENQVIVSGTTKIGVDKDDNGVYLPTYETSLFDYEMFVEIDGQIDNGLNINLEGAERRYIDRQADDITDTIGRLVVTKNNGVDFTLNELKKVHYQGVSLFADINSGVENQIILSNINPFPLLVEVDIDPKIGTIEKGGNQLFTALVTNDDIPAKGVTWSVSGNSSNNTIITNGSLVVGEDETASVLIVTATSVKDVSKSASAVVNVIEKPSLSLVLIQDKEKVLLNEYSIAQFTAQIVTTSTMPTIVTFSITGANHPGTIINSTTGQLVIDKNETSNNISVNAIATNNGTKEKSVSASKNIELVEISVGISPKKVKLEQGSTQKFEAKISNDLYLDGIKWDVSGNTSSLTKVTDGVLLVGVDETSDVLIITVTSLRDDSKYANSEITVIKSNTTPGNPSAELPSSGMDSYTKLIGFSLSIVGASVLIISKKKRTSKKNSNY